MKENNRLTAEIARLERVIELYDQDIIYLLNELKDARDRGEEVTTIDRLLKEFKAE